MKENNKTIWSVGATSRISIELQRIWARKGYRLILFSRNKKDLVDIAKDLMVHGAKEVSTHTLEEAPNDNNMDILLVSIGSLSDQKEWETSKDYRHREWYINTTLVMDWVERGAEIIEKSGKGQICVMTSVAADRAKKSNYAYGAAKASLDYYLKGVEHRLAPLKKTVSILKPGPTRSPMTASMGTKKMADPKDVAETLALAIEKGKSVAYAPSIWKYIMFIIKNIPKTLWHKTNF